VVTVRSFKIAILPAICWPSSTARDAALLSWGAETMMTRLVDEEALQDMTDELIGAWNQLELIYRVTQT